VFIYWDGYEIDGSDTDFDIILPENVQIIEFVDSFLSIPIFTAQTPIYNTLPSRSFNRGHIDSKDRISKTDFENRLLSGDYTEMSIMVYCQQPERLDDELRSQIYALSEGRKPQEKAYRIIQNPCTSPADKSAFMTVDLTIGKVLEDWNDTDFTFEGSENAYSYNFSLTCPAKKGSTLITLGIPVSSTYEYAMYIIKHMEEYFPSIKIWGGIECSCGAIFGNSLYAYEKVRVPISYSVKNTLKHLTEYGIVRSCISYYEKTWTTKYSKSGFYLNGQGDGWLSPPKADVSFDEYIELVDLVLQAESKPFEQISETAVNIQLPSPDFYAGNPDAVKILEEKLEKAVPYEVRETWHNQDWLYRGYISFVMVDDKPIREFRVRYQMKEYFFALLELAGSGTIDFIKKETYKWRNE